MTDKLEKANAIISEMFQNAQEKALTTFPMWMRLNLLCNMISRAVKEEHENDINWDKINYYLTHNVDEYDFNNFDEINNHEQLCCVAADAKCASIMGIWQRHTCKDCGSIFYMTYNEVQFYADRELRVPKRCKSCRDRKRQK